MKTIILAAAIALLPCTIYAHDSVIVIPLGKTTNIEAPIEWHGQWVGDTEYIEGDGIQYTGSSYICVGNHTASIANAPPNTSFWSLMNARGEKGDQGNSGATGPQGFQGISGLQGLKGDIGPQGERGDKGEQGPQGNTGAAGPQGLQGVVGFQGVPGLKGDVGNQGPQGEQGIQGIQGDSGEQGLKGDTGDIGISGTSQWTDEPDSVSTKVKVNIKAMLDVDGYVKLATYSDAPVECDSAYGGTIALTLNYEMCICNGSEWISGTDRETKCADDCFGEWGGDAFLDNCGVCVGGNTEIISECVMDCAGVWGGIAYLDNCGACVGGITGSIECDQDCSGTWGGSAYMDNCDVCVGGNTGSTECDKDCLGVWDGDATLDNCGVCDNDASNDDTTCIIVQNCDGTWSVDTATVFDRCGVCGGDGSTCTDQVDCSGEWPYVPGGSAIDTNGEPIATQPLPNSSYDSTRIFDLCGVCLTLMVDYGSGEELNHDWNQTCERDCAGILNGSNQVDSCGRCIDMDNPQETPHALCSADCDGELPYTDGTKAITDSSFDAWTWTWTGTLRDPNNGFGTRNDNSANDPTKSNDACDICDTDPTNDCMQTVDGFIWQAGTAATVVAEAEILIPGIRETYTHGATLGTSAAATFCETLSYGVPLATNWRLPTETELQTLVGSPLQSFTDVPYWSSSTNATDTHVSTLFHIGSTADTLDTATLHVRCLRDI